MTLADKLEQKARVIFRDKKWDKAFNKQTLKTMEDIYVNAFLRGIVEQKKHDLI